MPKSREAFWSEKFAKNVIRDARNFDLLREAGWQVFVVWECLTSEKELDGLARSLLAMPS